MKIKCIYSCTLDEQLAKEKLKQKDNHKAINRQIVKGVILIAAIVVPSLSTASIFTYSLQDLGNDHYRYIYNIGNNGTLPGEDAIKLYDILFDPILYSETSLNISSAPPISIDWSEQILNSAPDIPTTYDVFSNGTGIIAGAEVKGFAVDFLWLSTGLPSGQKYEIYDPLSFELLETGVTQALTSIPVPSTLPLFLTAILGVASFSKNVRLKILSFCNFNFLY
ncbi:MAG: hypothetical protein PHR94_05810 [Methylomonas lenta]|nr:hypothetical protein [Methylomonas lenta]